MNALEAASLVMIPSGYEDGTLGSLKPTDGTGDFTFSRGSNISATRVNADGNIEKGYENLLLQSNTFDTTWTTSAASVTGGQEGYDGTNDAWILDKSSFAGQVKQSISVSGVNTLSVYLKAGTLNFARIITTTGVVSVTIDLSNGVFASVSGGIISKTIESSGNGFYKVSISFTEPIGLIGFIPQESLAVLGVSGSIYIQDAMLNQGMVAYPYVETTTAPVAGGILEDMPRLDYSNGSCPSLLLEPSRTNLVPYSEYFGGWDISPTYTNATTQNKEGRNINSLYGGSAKSLTLPSAGTYSYSVYAKKDTWNFLVLRETNFATSSRTWFDLANGVVTNAGSSHGTPTITNEGNGWYRCTIYLTASTDLYGIISFAQAQTSGSVTQGTNDQEAIFVDMAQLEEGSYPTSYIPTYGVSQTRLADNPAQLDVTGLTSTYNTLYAEFEVSNIESSMQGKIALSDNSQNNRMTIFQNGDDLMLLFSAGGSSQTSITSSNILAVGTNYKVVAKHQNGSHALFINGTKIGEESSATPTGLIKLRFGNELDASLAQKFLGDINQALVFPTALSDEACIELTTI